MATFKSFEDIDAWQEARRLIQKIRMVCQRKAVVRDYAFIDQITRSARSIAANIAEGFEAMTVTEFIAFLGYAKRSAGETRSHLYDALDEKYINGNEFAEFAEQTRKIGRMIAGLIHYLQSTDKKRKRTSSSVPQTKNQ